MRAFGIDFGTTNSVLATTVGGAVDTIVLDEPPGGGWTGFDRVIPTVIGLPGGSPTFGWAAKRSADRTEGIKRLFASDDEVDIGGRPHKVEEAAAYFFRHLQQRAAQTITEPLDQAVVTIPANSRGKARYRTKLSAGLAGIEVLALINEPTAAAMAHARKIGTDERILVFDWGGGTLDVTILQAIEGAFLEQSSKGIPRLGGIDVDNAFLAAVRPSLPGSDRWSNAELQEARYELERVKIMLSSQESAQMALPTGGYAEVTRKVFETAVMPLVEQSLEPVRQCLQESPGRVDHLVMVGGSSKIPLAQALVTEVSGIRASTDVDPMTAIAEGAAIAAGILLGVIDDIDFFVGTEHALGTVVHNPGSPPEGDFSVLISRNTKLPAKATDRYTPAQDYQESVDVLVIEGDPANGVEHEDNVILKKWTIDLEPRPVSDASFEMTYSYDVDGILHVMASDLKTGTVLMDGEVSFGAAEDRSTLPEMRRRIDSVMGDGATVPLVGAPPPATGLDPASAASVAKARTKVIPMVDEHDRDQLEALVAQLEQASPEARDEHRAALDRELRKHAYLL